VKRIFYRISATSENEKLPAFHKIPTFRIRSRVARVSCLRYKETRWRKISSERLDVRRSWYFSMMKETSLHAHMTVSCWRWQLAGDPVITTDTTTLSRKFVNKSFALLDIDGVWEARERRFSDTTGGFHTLAKEKRDTREKLKILIPLENRNKDDWEKYAFNKIARCFDASLAFWRNFKREILRVIENDTI